MTGPLENRRGRDRVDDPLYNIDEQKRRGAQRLSLWEDDPRIAPNTFSTRPSPTGLTDPR